MAGFSDILKGAQGMVNNPMFAAGASIYSGAPVGQAMGNMQRMGMMREQQDQQAQQREQWQKFSQSANVPGNLKPLLPFMSPAQGAGMIANSAPKQAARPWWAGQNGQVDPAMMAKTTAGRASTNVTVNGSSPVQEKAFDKEVGKSYAKMFTDGVKGGMAARKNMNNLKVLQSALDDPNLYQGPAGNTIHAAKKALQSWTGLAVKGVGSGELVQTLSKKAALALKGDLPGPLSNSDREFLVALPPGLGKSPEGNRLIAKLGLLQNEYTIARSQAAVEYARQNRGRMDLGFTKYLEKVEGDYGQRFSGLVQKLRGMGEAPPRSPMAGLDALKQKYRP